MQTHFAAEQLADPQTQALEKILRSCVHCGFCTATCPTYVVTGDERDSPRGRIYLIKDLLESGRAPTDDDVWPIDHCLSCNACMTTCPSGVEYRRLIDHARVLVETRYQRPLADRLMRAALARLLPSRRLFALGLRLAALARPFAPLIAALPRVGPQLAAMLALAAKRRTRCDGRERRDAGRRRRRDAPPRRAADRLRAGGAGAGDQRRDDAPAGARRHRGRAGAGRRLLRLAAASHGPRGRGARADARQRRRLDAR